MVATNAGEIQINHIGPSKYLAAKGVGGQDRKDRRITSNSISASFIVSYKGKSLVFISGDIDQISLDEIKYIGNDIKANVLVFPHHGGKIEVGNVVDFTKQLISESNPDTIVFSIGRRKFKNPRPEVIKAIKTSAAKRQPAPGLSRCVLVK